jgi:hypothetical protein
MQKICKPKGVIKHGFIVYAKILSILFIFAVILTFVSKGNLIYGAILVLVGAILFNASDCILALNVFKDTKVLGEK